MPAINKVQRRTMVLDCDKDDPPAKRATFFARQLSVGEKQEVLSLMDQLDQPIDATNPIESTNERFEAMATAAKICISGWEKVVHPETGKPLPFSKDAIKNVLTESEIMEVVNYVLRLSGVEDGELKKSARPHSSGAANSASRARRRVKK